MWEDLTERGTERFVETAWMFEMAALENKARAVCTICVYRQVNQGVVSNEDVYSIYPCPRGTRDKFYEA